MKAIFFVIVNLLLPFFIWGYVEDNVFLQYMNTNADPCQDFYDYTCGNFKTVHPLSGDDLIIDHFSILEDQLIDLTHSILSSEERDEDPQALKKAKSAYSSCVDVNYLNLVNTPEMEIIKDEHGFPLVEPFYRQIYETYGWKDIGNAVSKYGVPMLFTILAYSNMVDSSKNVIYITNDTIANPALLRPYETLSHEAIIEKGFLDLIESQSVNHRLRASEAPFDIFLKRIAFKLARANGYSISEREVINNISEMANFMKGVYFGGYIPPSVTVNPFGSGMNVTLKEMNRWTKDHFGDEVQLDWVEYMREVFKSSGIEINEETQVLNYNGLEQLVYGIINWVHMNRESVVKSFVMMRVFLYMAPDSDAESRYALEEYYSKINIQLYPRWKYCTRKIIDSIGTTGLSFAVAYEYQLRHFNVNGLNKAVQMVRDLQASFKELIKETDWMDDNSKELALDKLENLVTILGYPDFVSNRTALDKFYENLRICKWDNYGNSKRIRAFKLAYQLSQVQKRDRAFWDKSPFEVNAYYNRPNNKIIFPVGILNPIFFGSSNSVFDYGRIGSIIGHEITHGFDKQGSMYDQEGLMLPWWTSDTKTAFTNKISCFVEQYKQYYMSEIGEYVNGNLTLNENIADNGGVRESYKAMKKLLQRNGMNSFNNNYGFTPEQLFFIGFGSMWCNNPSTTYLNIMKTQEHAQSKWRVNGVVSNMEEFSAAFNCPSGSKMNPVNKCKLW